MRAVIPRRSDLPGDRGVLIVSHSIFRKKATFFILLQSEYGDVYKATVVYQEATVSEVRIKYFDTIPPCAAICLMRTGFLFAASEFGNHALYKVEVRAACEQQRTAELAAPHIPESLDAVAPRPLCLRVCALALFTSRRLTRPHALFFLFLSQRAFRFAIRATARTPTRPRPPPPPSSRPRRATSPSSSSPAPC